MAKKMREWKELGIKLDPESGIGNDYAEFYTRDREVAIKMKFAYRDEKGNEFLESNKGERVRI